MLRRRSRIASKSPTHSTIQYIQIILPFLPHLSFEVTYFLSPPYLQLHLHAYLFFICTCSEPKTNVRKNVPTPAMHICMPVPMYICTVKLEYEYVCAACAHQLKVFIFFVPLLSYTKFLCYS
ncbi:hypothetical protein EYC84_009559 [Monilinia fructicola]|uniref:Uncharacterized protein n=1 Tax=Monilinia fructicola TaxID=38448 RepID=A0A5M9J7Y3_MONFR|nr:hypothetical protein EYC84_009559 [Monilinia fructicola]